jgi:hypothetical protein
MAKAVEGLIAKLDAQFLEQIAMDAMGIVVACVHVDNPRITNLPLSCHPFRLGFGCSTRLI